MQESIDKTIQFQKRWDNIFRCWEVCYLYRNASFSKACTSFLWQSLFQDYYSGSELEFTFAVRLRSLLFQRIWGHSLLDLKYFLSHNLESLFLWNMSNKSTILLPVQNIFFGHCFWKRTRRPVGWLSRELYFFAGNSLKTVKNLMIITDSLLNHLKVHRKQLMPSICVTSSSCTICFHCTNFSGHLKGCRIIESLRLEKTSKMYFTYCPNYFESNT